MKALALAALCALPLFGSAAPGCKEGPPKLEGPSVFSSASTSASALATPAVTTPPAPPPDKFPLTDDQLAKLINPSGATEYNGPTGVIEGVIKVKGDPPVIRAFQTLPAGCEGSKAIHAPTFRAGAKGELADVLIAVIKVSGYVRPSKDDKLVTIRNCSLEPTVIDLSFGQRLMIANADKMPYMPQLATKQIVQRLAMQNMSPVPMIITQPGVYGLTWLAGELPGSNVPTAMIFVMPSALHSVTNLDGKFRITGVPVGSATVSASHIILGEKSQVVDVKAGQEHHVELTFEHKAPSPAASASAKKLPPGMDKPLQ